MQLGVPRSTISDQDPKFRSKLWKKLFKLLKVDLLVSTAYHSQKNSLSKHTNQTVEIALKYLISASPGAAWHKSLPSLQSVFINAIVNTMRLLPNKVLYGHATCEGPRLLDFQPKTYHGRTSKSYSDKKQLTQLILLTLKLSCSITVRINSSS